MGLAVGGLLVCPELLRGGVTAGKFGLMLNEMGCQRPTCYSLSFSGLESRRGFSGFLSDGTTTR